MRIHRWNDIALEQTNPSFARQVIHSERMTIALVRLKAGGTVPEHQHENEQVCVMVEGRIRFISGGVEYEIRGGEALQIPPNLPHSVVALEDSIAYDLFSPPRADWMRGDDAYLRQTETR